MKKPLQEGDFVFVSWSPKLDPSKKSAIGYLHHIYTHESGDQVGFIVGSEDRTRANATVFPHARRITESSALRVRRLFAPEPRQSRYNQIWQFLINEHRKGKGMKWFKGNMDGKREGLIRARDQRHAAELSQTSIHTFTRNWHVIDDKEEFRSMKPETLYTRPFDTQEWIEGRCDIPKKKPSMA